MLRPYLKFVKKKMYDNLFSRPKSCKNDIPSLHAANGIFLIAIRYVNIPY